MDLGADDADPDDEDVADEVIEGVPLEDSGVGDDDGEWAQLSREELLALIQDTKRMKRMASTSWELGKCLFSRMLYLQTKYF